MSQPLRSPGLRCPQCSGRMETKDSRPTDYRGRPSIRRRRRCRRCGWAVTTYEVFDNTLIQADARLSAVMLSLRRAHEAIGVLLASFDVSSEDEIPGGPTTASVRPQPHGSVPVGE